MPRPAIEPRKQPRQARAAATVEAVVEATARILETDGLAGLNTNAIAARAGVGIGSLYQYFPTKEAILVEMIRRKRRELLDDIRAAAARGRTSALADAVDALIAAAIAHQLDRPGLARALEYAEGQLGLDTETETLKQAITAEVAAVLSAQGLADPQVAAADVVALARGMIDAAGIAGETDRTALAARVRRGALGYLLA